jgi:hypothetical protein
MGIQITYVTVQEFLKNGGVLKKDRHIYGVSTQGGVNDLGKFIKLGEGDIVYVDSAKNPYDVYQHAPTKAHVRCTMIPEYK